MQNPQSTRVHCNLYHSYTLALMIDMVWQCLKCVFSSIKKDDAMPLVWRLFSSKALSSEDSLVWNICIVLSHHTLNYRNIIYRSFGLLNHRTIEPWNLSIKEQSQRKISVTCRCWWDTIDLQHVNRSGDNTDHMPSCIAHWRWLMEWRMLCDTESASSIIIWLCTIHGEKGNYKRDSCSGCGKRYGVITWETIRQSNKSHTTLKYWSIWLDRKFVCLLEWGCMTVMVIYLFPINLGGKKLNKVFISKWWNGIWDVVRYCKLQ